MIGPPLTDSEWLMLLDALKNMGLVIVRADRATEQVTVEPPPVSLTA